MNTPKPLSKRINIYVQNPTIIAAHRMAVRLGLIRATSTDARMEKLLAAELRKIAPQLRAEKGKLSSSDAAILMLALDTAFSK